MTNYNYADDVMKSRQITMRTEKKETKNKKQKRKAIIRDERSRSGKTHPGNDLTS